MESGQAAAPVKQVQARPGTRSRAPADAKQATVPVKRDAAKVGRNDPCPCGSGKKYKNCHGRQA